LRRRYGPTTRWSPSARPQPLSRCWSGYIVRVHRPRLIIADQWMPQMPGVEFLTRAHQLHPWARRVLLIGAMDYSVNQPMAQAMALGRIDGWLWKPWEPAEEHLYLPVSEQLTDWARATGQPGFVAWRIVGEQWTPRSHELRDLLDRNAIPYQFLTHDSEAGRELLRESARTAPACRFLSCSTDGCWLTRPTPRPPLPSAWRPVPSRTATTSSWWAPDRPGCRRPPTAPPRGCARSWEPTPVLLFHRYLDATLRLQSDFRSTRPAVAPYRGGCRPRSAGCQRASPTGGKSISSQSTGTLDATGCRPHVLTAIQQA